MSDTARQKFVTVLLPCALLVAAVLSWAISLSDVNLGPMTDIGLISVLPASYFVALGLLTGAFCLALRSAVLRGQLLLLCVAILIFILYGTPALVEQTPRIAVTWRHIGLIDYMMHYGKILPKFDAYFNWPGFFAVGALFTQTAGLANPIGIAPWANVFFNALYLAPLAMIYRSATGNSRLVWLGIWFFYLTNWVGQDYLSPQGFDYFLYLAVLAILLGFFSSNSPSIIPNASVAQLLTTRFPWLGRLIDGWPGRSETVVLGPRQRVGLMAAAIVIYAAMIPTHQLTPFAALLCVTALVIFNRVTPKSLPVLMAVMILAWTMFGAISYLAGHLQPLITTVGAVGKNVDRGVVGRLRGSPDHVLVVNSRLVMTLAVSLMATAGLARRLLGGNRDLSIALLALAPGTLLLAQYGGEMFLRVYFFSLPSLAFFAAALFCQADQGVLSTAYLQANVKSSRMRQISRSIDSKRVPLVSIPQPRISWRSTIAIALATLALASAFLLTRYGNERMDYFTPKEVEAARFMYSVAPPGSLFMAPGISEPWQFQGYTTYKTKWIGNEVVRTGDIAALEQTMSRNSKGSYLLITRSAVATLELYAGMSPATVETFENKVDGSPSFAKIYENPDARVYKYVGSSSRGSP